MFEIEVSGNKKELETVHQLLVENFPKFVFEFKNNARLPNDPNAWAIYCTIDKNSDLQRSLVRAAEIFAGGAKRMYRHLAQVHGWCE